MSTPAASVDATPPPPASVSFREAVRVWAKIGLLSFGGPAGQIALMHRELVEKRRWIDDARFLHALNYCTLLPGPEAQQLATYIGWLMHKTRGGLVAGSLFVLPGFVGILGLSMLYARYRELALVTALFFGLKAAVLAVVVEAVIRIGTRALRSRLMFAVASVAFLALFLLGVPFPVVVVAAGAFGLFGRRVWPAAFPEPKAVHLTHGGRTVIDRMAAAGELDHVRPSGGRAARVLLVAVVLWLGPVLLAGPLVGGDHVLVKEAAFFSRAAVVTFGGAYAVLAYVAQEAVASYQWLAPGEMLDGLGLAETTPGPLILVLEFVGFLGAFRHAGDLPPMAAGALGALVTVWVTFVPCFVWIFLGAPYIESLRENRALNAALGSITAAVVGVILNLSLWFALHVVFGEVVERHVGPLRLLVPNLRSLDTAAAVLVLFSLFAMFRLRMGMAKTLALSALCGAAWRLLA